MAKKNNILMHVVGARPNFMKAAPVIDALLRRSITQLLVNTGQHYDDNMAGIFFEQLRLPKPDFNLEVGSGSHAIQTARIMMEFEKVVVECKPSLVLVYGDVNSTVAAALVCAKLQTPTAHVEAGLRSFDRTMPEEINRLITDQIADFLFTPSPDGDRNLLREGIPSEKIHLVGNVMIDTLTRLMPLSDQSRVFSRLELKSKRYGLVTLHRPSNVDGTDMLTKIMGALDHISNALPLLFPIHPRTRDRLKLLGLLNSANRRLLLLEPLGYLDFLRLQRDAALVITDSGGIQEETTFLGVPCLTVRNNTERPVTVEVGTNTLVGQDMELLLREVERILEGKGKQGSVPLWWDGKASERIAETLITCQH